MAATASQIRLSTTQRQVVEFGDGPLLVVAGPGTGKTRVLTERVRRLLSISREHFRVLALTFTNKAAREMQERLDDLGELGRRTFIGTLHGFCLDMLSDRGKPVGINSTPQIFEQFADRKQVLAEAVAADPLLNHELMMAGDTRDRTRKLERWLAAISNVKNHPITMAVISDPFEQRIFDAYNLGLEASGAHDFDDLLLLAYRLLTENEKIAAFYRRLYRYICIDEAQDLNEAQYAVVKALCGADFNNVMMVGDHNQSIYGFSTSSPKYMQAFARDFLAIKIDLDENFRSSKVVVDIAHALEPTYSVKGQLPIKGHAALLVGADEEGEAKLVADEIQRLCKEGHPDIEGPITPASCAVLGRTRYTLLAVENELSAREVPHFKRVTSLHENESKLADDFQLALRILGNPRDQLHMAALLKRWDLNIEDKVMSEAAQVTDLLDECAHLTARPECQAISDAIKLLSRNSARLNIKPAIDVLRKHADTLPTNDRGAIYDDTEVMLREWDQYLRSGSSQTRALPGFLSSMALGTSQQIKSDGAAALLTIHSSKGLEFGVVFIVGMAEGVFPDYRSQGKPTEMAEEKRNAFVAVTRSRRLLYFSYPRQRMMPWGDIRVSKPSVFLTQVSAFL
jgi:DNA helicase II / ATP-dependent DNA helicase PcrA